MALPIQRLNFLCSILAVFGIAAIACPKQGIAGGSAAVPIDIWSGSYGDHESQDTVLVRKTRAWNQLWDRIGKEPPSVFPENGAAVAFLAASQSTAGYTITTSRSRKGATLCLSWSVEPPSGVAAQVITQPWHVQLYRFPGNDIEGLGLAGTASCQGE